MVDRVVDVVAHQQSAHGNEATAQPFGHYDHIRLHMEMMIGEELSSTVNAGLDLVENEQRAEPFAQCCRFFQIAGIGDANAGLALYRLHDKCRELSRRKVS